MVVTDVDLVHKLKSLPGETRAELLDLLGIFSSKGIEKTADILERKLDRADARPKRAQG